MSVSLENKKFNVVSLFSGAGGLDIGFERSGFRTISMCEIEPNFVDTLKKNQGWVHNDGRSYFEKTRIICSDIKKLTGKDLAGNEKIDCIIGGPPCQSFSSAGKQRSVLDDRGALVHEFSRLIRELRPRTFLFENVRGLITARDAKGRPGGVIRSIFDELESLEYSCRAALLNSADYGSFQRRVRIFIIGVRNGTAPFFPARTHMAMSSSEQNLFAEPWRTLAEFLEKYSDSNKNAFVFPTAELSRQLKCVPNGSGLKSKGVAEPTRPGGHWGYRQGTFIADLNLPARTVTGSSSQDWIRWQGLLRRLTLLEVKRLQGFPDDWIFCGTKAEVYKQIGNAVPTLFGEILANTIQEYLVKKHTGKAIKLGFPEEFEKYINYTVSDHRRNASARKVHQYFGGCNME